MNGLLHQSHHAFRRWLALAACLLFLCGEWLVRAQDEPGTIPAPMAPAGIPASRQASDIAVITISGPIDGVTHQSIERRLKAAEAAGADAVVFEIDTPGGLADAALNICALIKQSPIRNTVAWIHPQAYSAGTLIALACREIVMSPGARMGDCAPIVPGLIPLPAAERAKAESPLLAEVVDSARRSGYDERLAMSFIAVDIEIWLVENRETGDRLFVDRAEYRTLFGDEPPDSARVQASGGAPPTDPSKIPLIGRFYEEGEQEPSLTSEERAKLVEMQQELSSQRPAISAEDRDRYVLIETVDDARTLLVVQDQSALRWGLSKRTVADDEELKAFFGATSLTRYNASWSEKFVQKLTTLPVRVVLFLVFIVGLLWEMATPGLGVPGGVALAAALVLFGAPALTGMAQWWDIALILLGLALVAVELFVLPGFGVAGVLGLLCVGVGFIGTFVAPDPGGGFLPTSPDARQGLLNGLGMLILALFSGGVVVWFGLKHHQRVPGLNRLVLVERLGRDTDEPPSSLLAAMAPAEGSEPSPDDVGEAVTPLRPVGRARFGGRTYDVVAGRGVVEPGQAVRVTAASGFQIVVEAVE